MNATFDNLTAELWKQFEKGMEMAFATSADGKVTNRILVVAPCDGKLYMLTSTNSTKYPQLVSNPNVGLCAGMLQMTGTARALGHPLDAGNEKPIGAYKAIYPEYSNDFAAMPDYALVEIAPQTAVFYIENGEHAGGYTLDFAAKTGNKL